MRKDWTALPDAVASGIAERAGGTRVTPASGGDHAEIAATVAGPDGKVFVKAACSELGQRSLRYEVAATLAVDLPYRPRIHWQFETDGWLVAGFEHLDGRHADLAPGSQDLGLLAAALEDLARTPAACGQQWFTPAGRLGFSHPAMNGGTLVHSDLNPTNLIMTGTGLRIVDWAYATKAAPWVELALIPQWLIGSGHAPEQAERWLTALSAWSTTGPATLDYFAFRNAEKWSSKAQSSTAAWVHDLAEWTKRWAAYRQDLR